MRHIQMIARADYPASFLVMSRPYLMQFAAANAANLIESCKQFPPTPEDPKRGAPGVLCKSVSWAHHMYVGSLRIQAELVFSIICAQVEDSANLFDAHHDEVGALMCRAMDVFNQWITTHNAAYGVHQSHVEPDWTRLNERFLETLKADAFVSA